MFELDVYLRERLVGRTTFTSDEVRIGRGVDNELQIDNLALSRYHASVEVIDGLHIIKDFGSQNGTFVNGEKVTGRRALNDGDRIGLGKFVIVFRCDTPPEEKKKADPKAAEDKAKDAAFKIAGETVVSRLATDTRERTCPHVGYLSRDGGEPDKKPEIFPVHRDIFVIGSGSPLDVMLDSGPARAAAIVRAWRGFTLVVMAPGSVVRNGEPVDLRIDLTDGDQLEIGGSRFAFHMGTPEAGP
jgi:pSer/pThr/pTyr-binding forkhead associated (FHA) protein